MKKKIQKYHNKKVTVDGILFDSKKEADRYRTLKAMERQKKISHLERQVKYVLIPAQREPDTIGPRGGTKRGKVIEKECSYIADFKYFDEVEGCTVVEDTKGIRTKDYIIKRKLMLWVHKIKVKEI